MYFMNDNLWEKFVNYIFNLNKYDEIENKCKTGTDDI
jgi:hypothetical protein